MHVLERLSENPSKYPESTLEPFRSKLDDILETAARVLGPDDSMLPTIEYLKQEFGTPAEISLNLVHRNLPLISLVAGALDLRFNLQPGGGQGGQGFSISQFPQNEYTRII